ncbi:unnamed protein product, partial [Closterium sp. NIES-53]
CFALLDWSCDLLFSPTLPMGSGLGFVSRCMHMLAVPAVPSPGPPGVGGCQKTCTVRSPIDPWRVTSLLAWGVMGALIRY